MSDVTLQIGGRPYTVSCADGEEEHLRRLAGIVDARVAALGGATPLGEAKSLLIAALVLADEVEDAGRRAPPAPPAEPILRGLENLAARLEGVARVLESTPTNA